MANVGTKAAPEGTDVKNIAPKDASILSLKENHKLAYKGYGSYTNDTGIKLLVFTFDTDSASNPTYFSFNGCILLDEGDTLAAGDSYYVVFFEGL